MRPKRHFSLFAALAVACLPGLFAEPAEAQRFGKQSIVSNQAVQQQRQPSAQSGTHGTQNSDFGNQQLKANVKSQRPWQISSRIHLQKGSTEGYLVVQLDLAPGYHVYSLNPEGSPAPTKLQVAPSNDLKIQSKFVSDTPPVVIEKDPVFGQRIEKHKSKVQFFATIAVRPGTDLKKLSQKVTFSGQVCSDSACQPIRNQTAEAKFAGYFEVPKTRKAAAEQKLK